MAKVESYADAPQEIKDAVAHLIRTYGSDEGLLAGATVSAMVLAIEAAKAGAYTDAAGLAQRMGAGRKSQAAQAKFAKQGLVARDFESMAISAFDVAVAIRKRGEVNTAHKISEIED